jgi:hypothetical protein
MVNTRVLSVFERTRELGMLRAVGMSRRQTPRMIRHESVITVPDRSCTGDPAWARPGGTGHQGALEVRRPVLGSDRNARRLHDRRRHGRSGLSCLASTSRGTAQRPQGAPVRVNNPRRGGGWNAASPRPPTKQQRASEEARATTAVTVPPSASAVADSGELLGQAAAEGRHESEDA